MLCLPVGLVAVEANWKPSEYATLMRTWPGFEAGEFVLDHVFRSLSHRDYRLFRAMRQGDDYPRAYTLAMSLFQQAFSASQRAGTKLKELDADYANLMKEYVPPYDPGKLPNKWRKWSRIGQLER
jgi:DNA (cytosine-5)-methyltransferase 1